MDFCSVVVFTWRVLPLGPELGRPFLLRGLLNALGCPVIADQTPMSGLPDGALQTGQRELGQDHHIAATDVTDHRSRGWPRTAANER